MCLSSIFGHEDKNIDPIIGHLFTAAYVICPLFGERLEGDRPHSDRKYLYLKFQYFLVV